VNQGARAATNVHWCPSTVFDLTSIITNHFLSLYSTCIFLSSLLLPQLNQLYPAAVTSPISAHINNHESPTNLHRPSQPQLQRRNTQYPVTKRSPTSVTKRSPTTTIWRCTSATLTTRCLCVTGSNVSAKTRARCKVRQAYHSTTTVLRRKRTRKA